MSHLTRNRCRTLLVTRNFPPLLGGMERLNQHLSEVLTEQGPVHIVAPQGAPAQAPVGTVVSEVPLTPLWRFLLTAAWTSATVAWRNKPDLTLAGSGLTAPQAWLAARCSGARSAIYLHGLDIVLSKRLYRWLWHPFIRRMDLVIANSRATAALATDIGIAAQRITVIHPGVTLPPHIDEEERRGIRRRFRHRFHLEDGPLLLAVGRLTTRKGLLEFVRDVLPLIEKAVPGSRLVVIGDTPDDALAACAQTPEQIRKAAAVHGLADRIHFLGRITDALLQSAYWSADLHVFPVRPLPGDPEGFGMVAVEAAAHGLPTLAYATGGVVDAVSDGLSGRLVPPGNFTAFAHAASDLLHHPLPRKPIEDFAMDFSWERFGHRIRRALCS